MKNLFLFALLASLGASLVAQRPFHPRVSPRHDARPPATQGQEPDAGARHGRGAPDATAPRADLPRLQQLRERLRERMQDRAQAPAPRPEDRGARGRPDARRPRAVPPLHEDLRARLQERWQGDRRPAGRQRAALPPFATHRALRAAALRAAFLRGFAVGQRDSQGGARSAPVRRR